MLEADQRFREPILPRNTTISNIRSNNPNSESDRSPCCKPSHFAWSELVTSDLEGSAVFYATLFGWSITPFGSDYALFKKAGTEVAGMMKAPQPETPAQWRAYVMVEDVDEVVAKATEFGGKTLLQPLNIPEVGRIAIVTDPHGAAIGLFKPLD